MSAYIHCPSCGCETVDVDNPDECECEFHTSCSRRRVVCKAWAHDPRCPGGIGCIDQRNGPANRAEAARVAQASTTADDSARLAQEDLRAIMRALGLSDHARPVSPHRVVVDEVIPRANEMLALLRRLVSRADDVPPGALKGEDSDLVRDARALLGGFVVGGRVFVDHPSSRGWGIFVGWVWPENADPFEPPKPPKRLAAVDIGAHKAIWYEESAVRPDPGPLPFQTPREEAP